MKKNRIALAGLLFILLTACNNGGKKGEQDVRAPKTRTDSLLADVMDGHDAGMAKYGTLKGMQKKVQEALDSIGKLPSKAQQEASVFKAGLDTAAKELNDALVAMDKWMEEFNMDSALDNMEQRINYLTDEKMKVGKVKEAILNSLRKADSLFRTR